MRLTLQRVLRVLLASSMLMFVVLNMRVFYQTPDSSISSHSLIALESSSKPAIGQSPSAQKINFVNNSPQVSDETTYQTYLANNSEALKQEVVRINTEQLIHNLDKYPLNLSSDSLVIVIQTHDRPEYLHILIESLRNVLDIQNTLLIISHDVYSDKLNKIVEAVDFCPVMQIFYSFSQQIYSNEFPGEHPNDCPRDIKKEDAVKKKCNNAETPDKYGHYREAKYCQAKHHWIWKLHHLFEEIRVLDGYEGDVMLLEDDYYLSNDIINSTRKLKTLRDRNCPECSMLVLGNYEKNQNYHINGAKVEKALWISSKHNMGMTFNRKLWLDIKKCADNFCEFDDYNWDWTLQHVSVTCIPNKIQVLIMKATRIFHIGECGMHKKSKNCDPMTKVKEAETKLQENEQYLYPDVMSIAGESRIKLRDPKPNGGWGDIRDHKLCKHYFNTTDNR